MSSQEFGKAHAHASEERGETKKPSSTSSLRVARYPTIRTSDHSDTSPILKKISVPKKLKNVKKKNVKEKEDEGKIAYYAELIADKLGDRKSLSYFRLACRTYPPERLYQKASEIVTDGGAKNPAAVFVAWLKNEHRGTSPSKSDHPG